MVNLKYPEFKFDKWLKEYVVAVSQIMKNKDLEEGEFEEMQEFYEAQQYEVTDEQLCRACQYLKWINNFSDFMRYVTQHDMTKAVAEMHFIWFYRCSSYEAGIMVGILNENLQLNLK
jgi:hypothetical protein